MDCMCKQRYADFNAKVNEREWIDRVVPQACVLGYCRMTSARMLMGHFKWTDTEPSVPKVLF